MIEETKTKKPFLQKVPGFRSGKWWKKTIAVVGYLFILLIIIAMMLPGPGVEGHVKDARSSLEDGYLATALSSYEKALEKWEEENGEYPFKKTEIEEEYSRAKNAYAEQLAIEARQNIDSQNFDEAETLISTALRHSESNERVIAVSNELNKIKDTQKADGYLDEALTAYEEGNIGEAMSKLNAAMILASDYDRIEEVKQTLSSAIEAEVKKHLNTALDAVEEWKIDEAKKALNTAMNLVPDSLDDDRFNEAREKISEAESVVNEIGPKPENSEWDGAVKPVVDYLNANLRDPGSCEYIEWSPVFLQNLSGEKYWAVRVKYRAKNAFGGYVIEEKIAWIRNDEVVLMTDF